MSQTPHITIDIVQYQRVLQRVMKNPVEGVDTITAAARICTNTPGLVLTKEHRTALKRLSHGTLYGMGAQSFYDSLFPKESTK